MGLESLLKQAKTVDTEALRQYTKVTKRWEDQGRSRYSLSHLINIHSLLMTAGFSYGEIIIGTIQSAYLTTNHGWMIADDILIKSYGNDFNATDSARVMKEENSIENLMVACQRGVRLPSLGVGIGYAGWGFSEIMYGLMSGETSSVTNGVQDVLHGLPFIGIASSMYVKDADPKLLERKPSKGRAFFKEVYERIRGFLPSPHPAPQHVSAQF